ncbi:MAG: Crp/Fnr family transcriptional regulator [Alphaproteobacteria bacterium]|jgi:CRP-like cAMP-binding protein|nr:Crp/Fnr family transcriptional regulator [Alphaproteobacteria bacterium]
MSLNQEVELLRTIPLFAKIEASKLKLLAFTSERLTFEAGQDLCRQGDMGDAMYVIVEGAADVLIDTPKGPLKVAELKKNEFVGEIAILCDVPRTATVTAREKTTTLKITKDLFFRLVQEFPQMAVEIMRELAHRLEMNNLRMRQLQAQQKN